jgi:hypothetical protein
MQLIWVTYIRCNNNTFPHHGQKRERKTRKKSWNFSAFSLGCHIKTLWLPIWLAGLLIPLCSALGPAAH